MKLIFTHHAKQRIKERKITLQQIQETINFPDYKISKEDKIESYKRIDNKLLKIIYAQKGKFIKIITLIWK